MKNTKTLLTLWLRLCSLPTLKYEYINAEAHSSNEVKGLKSQKNLYIKNIQL